MPTVRPVNHNLVRWLNGPEGNIGVVVETTPDGRCVRVRFDSGEELSFASPTDVLERVRFAIGALLESLADRVVGVVGGTVENGNVVYYRLNLPGGAQKLVMESGVRPAVVTDPVALLRAGDLHAAWSCNLRTVATQLLFAHQYDELSCLSNSRVAIKPHQVGVVHRVVTGYPHRFLLCDEVGLGKTIEAGLILKELKARGVANRVLILAPSNLVSQWQYELKTKFNEVFSHYNSATTAYLQADNPAENVWTLKENVIASTTYASWDENRQKQIALAGWDLIILDEAHHARRQRHGDARYSQTTLYGLMEMLTDPEAGRSTSILFLTATPMQLDRFELYSLIELLDPSLFPDPRDFEEHCSALSRLNATVAAVRRWPALSLEEQAEAAAGAAPWLGDGAYLARLKLESDTGRRQALETLEDKHRLSQILIRNRKALVGGFMPRVAVIWPVELTAQEWEAYQAVTQYVRTGYANARVIQNNALGFLMATFQKLNASSSHALRQSLMRRIERLRAGLGGWAARVDIEDDILEELPTEESLGDLLGTRHALTTDAEIRQLTSIVQLLDSIDIDSKARVLQEGLAEIAHQEPDAKVIIFTQFRDTQEYLRGVIDCRWEVNFFHGQLKPDEKENSVARFRDHKGLQILISTESGGEGRNFQFSHTLINYDLPWNPMKIEQRIGRLDRIGQRHPIKIINLSLLGTIEERVLDVLARRIRVFEETIGGLDPILGEVEDDIKKIYMMAEAQAQRALMRLEGELETRVLAAREAERRMADFIMDTKSFRQDEVQRLLEQRGTMTTEALGRFVISSLKQLGVRLEPDPELQQVYKVRLRGQFLNEYPHFAQDGVERRITFDPSVALEYENTEFLAFGHPWVDELVERARRRGFPGLTSYRRIRTDANPPRSGWSFAYSLEYEGVRRAKEVLPVFIDLDGHYDPELSSWLLEQASLLRREDGESGHLPPRDGAFENAVGQAEIVAVQRLTQRQEELAASNREQLEQERTKLERFYDYRARAAQEKRDAVQRTLDRVSASDEPEVLRIIPVWAKNLENSKRVIENLVSERQRRLGALVGRDQVTAQQELLTASYVEIVPHDLVG